MKFKSTKVLATAVAVTIIATGVAGCNRDGGAGSSASGTVVFAVSTQTNPFFVQLVNGAKTVSYTHLTLPTIYSV